MREDRIRLVGLISSSDGKRIVRGEKAGAAGEAGTLGRHLAEELLSRGGAEILQEVYR